MRDLAFLRSTPCDKELKARTAVVLLGELAAINKKRRAGDE